MTVKSKVPAGAEEAGTTAGTTAGATTTTQVSSGNTNSTDASGVSVKDQILAYLDEHPKFLKPVARAKSATC